MTQMSKSADDLVRKIPVDRLEYRDSPIFFDVVFHPDSMRTYRKEFAILRKELKAYKQNCQGHITSHFMNTTGNCWYLHKDLLMQFSDFIELHEDLETLVARIIQEGRAEEERKKQEKKERRRRKLQELRARRIPCPNPGKVRLLKIEGITDTDPLNRYFFRDKDEPSLHYFRVQLDEGRTLQEKEARLCLSKTLLEDKEDYDKTLSFRKKYSIQGCGCNWELHEYALLAYSDWLELEEDIEVLIACESERLKRAAEEKAEAEWARWEQRHSQTLGGNRRSELDSSRTLFNLSESASLEDVKKRYKILAKLYHPDSGGNEEEFKRLNNANQVLMQHFA